jgi:hypothetical protein
MKVSEILKLAVAGGFIAADKKPEDLQAAILAADKAAKDAAGSGLGARELEEKDQAKDKAAKDKAAKDKAAKDKAAKDKAAKDRNDDPEHTNDEDVDAEDKDDMDADDENYSDGDPSTPGGSRSGGKTAIDSAEVDRRITRAVQARDALHTALREVEPIIGRVSFDSAGDAYRAALTHLKIDTKDIHPSAFPSMLKIAKDRANATAAPIAMDSTGVAGMEKLIPGYGRLR